LIAALSDELAIGARQLGRIRRRTAGHGNRRRDARDRFATRLGA
jgi:hypothetical protein